MHSCVCYIGDIKADTILFARAFTRLTDIVLYEKIRGTVIDCNHCIIPLLPMKLTLREAVAAAVSST